jgi:hypothetical protein
VGTYEGEFYAGRKKGKGKMSYSKGDTYEGTWLEDQPHGFGTYHNEQSSGISSLILRFVILILFCNAEDTKVSGCGGTNLGRAQ